MCTDWDFTQLQEKNMFVWNNPTLLYNESFMWNPPMSL